jgi:high-affinity iron transporter
VGASFLITLREGLEIALVLAILLGYLAKTGKRDRMRGVAVGAGAATVVCLVAGIIVHALTSGLTGKAEPAVEGTLSLLAAFVLTWMILWMRKNARNMGGELRSRLDGATTVGAVAVIAFVAVAREGFEATLFLLGAEAGNSSGTQVVIGGLLGLAVAAVIGVLVYRYGKNIDLRTFFRYTGVLLIFFAAGLVGKAVHEFGELLEFQGWWFGSVWTITSGPLATGFLHDFLEGMFGWSSEPERLRVAAYFAYLLPVLWIFLRPDPVSTAAPASTNNSAEASEHAGIHSPAAAEHR